MPICTRAFKLDTVFLPRDKADILYYADVTDCSLGGNLPAVWKQRLLRPLRLCPVEAQYMEGGLALSLAQWGGEKGEAVDYRVFPFFL